MTLKIQTPKSWELPAFEELTTFIIGGDWGKDAEFSDPAFDDALCIRGAEFRNWDAEKGRTASLRKIKASSINTRRLQEGDILVEISGGGPEQPVGRTALIDKAVLSFQPETPKVCTNFLRLVRLTEHTYSSFVNYFLNFFYASGEVSNYQAGSNNLRNLKFNDYVGIGIPLPPLNEQHRIVSKIEELFSELEKGVESLKAAKAQLAVYRQSVLKAAFEGRLTEAWRTEHAEGLESAEELVARTPCPPRPNRWNTRSKEVIKGHVALAVGNPQTPLPDGWIWCALVDVARMESGHTPSRNHPEWWNGDIPWIGIADAKAHTGSTIHDTIQHTNEDGLANSAARLLPAGTVCISRTASVGYVVVMGRDMATSQDFVNWVPTEAVTSDWLRVIFGADREYLRRFGKGTVHKTIYFPEWLSVHIALPPLEEQCQIVQEIESRFSVVEKMEQTIEESLQKAEALRQSILKQAFEGKLVPQDPSDEPASELIARIRAERENAKPAVKKRKAA